MAIPLEPDRMRSLIDGYREAWRAAGHPGNGHVMNTFFMCCAPTREEAMATGLGPCNGHLKGLALAAKEWLTGASTKDYPGYDKLIAHVTSDSAERQVRAGSAFIGTPADIVEMVRDLQRHGRRNRQRIAALHAIEHADRCRGTLATAVLARGDAEARNDLSHFRRWYEPCSRRGNGITVSGELIKK
jgi:alkanesulfonate monooxygenase SsuD/methylene tetrahydromethanopterin reductase-like flavin-dependent oxidoreductase (luciferase family)